MAKASKVPKLVTAINPAMITLATDEVRDMLIAKNQAYGDSAANPLRVFSGVDANVGIRVRIDDKLSRLARGSEFGDDDTILDLIGYLILLRIVEGKTPSALAPVAEEEAA